MFTRVFFLLLFFSTISLAVTAQTVKVKKENARIKNEYAEGFEVELPGTFEEIEAALEKFLKNYGKVKHNDDYLVVQEPVMNGYPSTTPLYGKARQLGNLVYAWIGAEPRKKEEEQMQGTLERLVQEFGINFHREKIQKQIDESTQALQAVERQTQRLVNQNKDLASKIESNQREKVKLDKALENNRLELISLQQKLEQNKKDQDSVAVATEQIKKVVEMHKDRQRKVN